MVHEMTKLLMEAGAEQSHLRSGVGQLIIIDRGDLVITLSFTHTRVIV